jgi:DNA-binding NtrC family response regulator
LITAEHLSLDRARSVPLPPVGASTTDLSAVERDMIAQVLADCSGNKSKAAARLGISRTQLYVRLRRYQLC